MAFDVEFHATGTWAEKIPGDVAFVFDGDKHAERRGGVGK
jgi:hypothetical protein